MSAADFKASLYAQLKTAGVMNSIKVNADIVYAIHVEQQQAKLCTSSSLLIEFHMASLSHFSPCWHGQTQLRAQVLSKLQHNSPSVAPPEPGADALFKRALNSIIAEYLSACHMHYTLSVFQPESGLSGTVHLSHSELARVLGLKPGSLLHSALARRGMAEGGHSKGERKVHMSCNMSLSRRVVPRQRCCLYTRPAPDVAMARSGCILLSQTWCLHQCRLTLIYTVQGALCMQVLPALGWPCWRLWKRSVQGQV